MCHISLSSHLSVGKKLHFDTKSLACSDMIASAPAGRWGPAGPVPASARSQGGSPVSSCLHQKVQELSFVGRSR